MSQSRGIKGHTTDDAFQEQHFLWEIRAPIDADFDLFNFRDLFHAQELK